MGVDHEIMTLTSKEAKVIKAYRAIAENQHYVDSVLDTVLKQMGIYLIEPFYQKEANNG